MDGWVADRVTGWMGGWLTGSPCLWYSWHTLEIDCYCAVRNLSVEVLEKGICVSYLWAALMSSWVLLVTEPAWLGLGLFFW